MEDLFTCACEDIYDGMDSQDVCNFECENYIDIFGHCNDQQTNDLK